MTKRARSDESGPPHAASEQDDLEDFRAGEEMVRPFVVAELGSVTGKSLLHLQCRLGHEALAWARRGASRVVGLDSSESAVEAARDLAADLGLPPDRASFVAADVYDAAGAVPDSAYDIVYTGPGALCRLPDLVRWAETAASLVAPDGVLYLADFHPLASSLIADDFGGDFGGDGSYPDLEGWGRQHTLGDVVTAVAATGLRLEFLHEHDGTHAPVPLMYSLRASRTAGPEPAGPERAAPEPAAAEPAVAEPASAEQASAEPAGPESAAAGPAGPEPDPVRHDPR